MDKRDFVNLFDFEAAAQAKLPQVAYDYYASGAGDEITLRENHSAYERIRLKPRVLRDISTRDLTTEVLCQTVAMPILVAPTAFHRMACEDGEVATARAAGCKAIALTVDAQIWGRRERDVRNRFRLPKGLTIKNLMPAGRDQFPDSESDSGLAAYVTWQFDPALEWKDVEWLCTNTKLPVLLKGVLHPADAHRALDHGAAGVIVSNHGAKMVLDTLRKEFELAMRLCGCTTVKEITTDLIGSHS